MRGRIAYSPTMSRTLSISSGSGDSLNGSDAAATRTLAAGRSYDSSRSPWPCLGCSSAWRLGGWFPACAPPRPRFPGSSRCPGARFVEQTIEPVAHKAGAPLAHRRRRHVQALRNGGAGPAGRAGFIRARRARCGALRERWAHESSCCRSDSVNLTVTMGRPLRMLTSSVSKTMWAPQMFHLFLLQDTSRLLKNTRIGLFSWPSCVSRPPRQRCARGHAVPTRGPATPAAGDQGHLASRFRNRTK